MNTTDKKVLDYLERAVEIYNTSFNGNGKVIPIKEDIVNFNIEILEIAKMIQTEELNDSNMQLFKDKK